MSSPHSLVKNLIYNISGPLLPFVVGAVCIPLVISRIGTERFGLLTIAWTVIGYLTIFDFGLGRSLTLHVSRSLGSGRPHEVKPIVRSALIMMFLISLIGPVMVLFFNDAFIAWLKVKPAYLNETRGSFLMLGFAIPLVVLTSGLRGVLEAFQRFDVTNGVRVLQGIWTFVGPVCVLPFSVRLDAMVAVLLVGRAASTLAYAVAVYRELPSSNSTHTTAVNLKDLLSYGGWTALSNMLSPVMEYMDRFFISSVLGAAVVAFYTTPYELVFRLNFISEGILGVLFPLMSKRLALSADGMAGEEMMSLGTKLMTACVFPFVLVIVIVAHPLLRLWLGPVFEQKSAFVLQVLALGLLVNSLAKVPSNLIQANGRSDITAILHLIELPVYILCLQWMLSRYGIEGAAVIWSLRMLLDLVLLLWVSGFVASVPIGAIWRLALVCTLQTLAVGGAILVDGIGWRVVYGAICLAVLSLAFYRYALLETERALLRQMARRALGMIARRIHNKRIDKTEA
ncbi:Membrane protein involved in the export of O-antigen and teichoic acid [Burkholderia sp. WP9]|uniref:flippase n=1 Tax=Burkholderia sp. WP9 TaxID=1500263 RepID=UPI00089CC08E|nr:flippase [Burkholderia sp. WP9]SED08478.1 Membrane protein involved in the export of O-antigen and teichoic acid [Burkholderia sp. WP9]